MAAMRSTAASRSLGLGLPSIAMRVSPVSYTHLDVYKRQVQGAPKTEASAKDVPLDAALAESLLKLRLVGPYNRETDWVLSLIHI